MSACSSIRAGRASYTGTPSQLNGPGASTGAAIAGVLDPSGASEINNYGPGDLWFFPKGHGHSIQTIGDKSCHFVLSFDNGAFSGARYLLNHGLD